MIGALGIRILHIIGVHNYINHVFRRGWNMQYNIIIWSHFIYIKSNIFLTMFWLGDVR